ncbi:hypothetical protein ACH4S8_20160 [Streptomyces sp. NPDC021080]|uniref:hypothetical protein n=1 Tax=Streptomyces sp. NPDC021080 TaxID=3365110 RepID=UPI0037BC2281
MTTILFVHGTGVRSRREKEALDRIEDGFRHALPDTTVETCSWGDALGVAPAGASAEEDGTGDAADPAPPDGLRVTWSDAERAVWARLYDDPLFEIRLAVSAEPGDASAVSPRVLELLLSRIRKASDEPAVQASMPPGESWDQLREAVAEMLRNTEFTAALPFLAARKSHDLVARCLTAFHVRVRERDGSTVVVSAMERDALWRVLEKCLGSAPLGLGDRTRAVAWSTAQHMARPVVRRHRGRLLTGATPALGDILLYQARGGPLRTFLAERVREIAGPVALLGHSLGGVACFESLVAHDLPNVRLLVTVGSQVPYLHGLDALATHRLGAPLPDHFRARWVNVVDPEDLLAFTAEDGFRGRVTDVEVDTREPFPRAHGAYWTTPQVYEAVRAAVEER